MTVDLETLKKLPPYIIVGDGGCAMRLRGYKYGNEYMVKYWRDGGLWGYERFRIEEDGKIVGEWPDGILGHLHNNELIPTTHEHWVNDNFGYVNKNSKAFNDPIPEDEPYDCCEDDEKNGWSSHCRTCGAPIVL